MQNKTVIRKQTAKGQFTTTHHSILNDKRLSAWGFRILVKILSDSDTKFRISRTGLRKHFDIDKDTVNRAFENLVECGYMKMTKIKNRNGYHYTISEYGNLNKSKSTNVLDKGVNSEKYKQNQEKLIAYVDGLGDYSSNDECMIEINKITQKYIVDGKLSDYYKPKSEIEKLIGNIKKGTYRNCINYNLNLFPKASQESIKWLKGYLKESIFDYNMIPNQEIVAKKWQYQRLKAKPFKTDYETAMADKREQEYEDRY